MDFLKFFTKKNTRIFSIILSFVLLVNMSIPVFAVSDNTVSNSGLLTCVTNFMNTAGIQFDPSDLQTVFDDFKAGFGTVKAGIAGAVEFCRGFLDYLYQNCFIIKSPVTGLPMLNITGTGTVTQDIIDSDDKLDQTRRPKGTPSISSNNFTFTSHDNTYTYHWTLLHDSFGYYLTESFDTIKIRLFSDPSSALPYFYTFYENSSTFDNQYPYSSFGSSFMGVRSYSRFFFNPNKSGDIICINCHKGICWSENYSCDMFFNPGTFFNPDTEGRIYTSVFGNLIRDGRHCSYTPVIAFYDQSDNIKKIMCTDSSHQIYDYFEYSDGWADFSSPKTSYFDARYYQGYSGVDSFVVGNSLFVHDNGALLFYNGVPYEVIFDGDNGFDFEPDPDDSDFVPVNTIINNVVNNYYNTYIISGNGTGTGSDTDYTGFFGDIIDILNSIDNKLSLILNKIDDQISAFTTNFNFVVNFETAITNTYNTLFVLNTEQKADIDTDLARLKSPFNWIFYFIDGTGSFLDSFASAASVYSTGQGFGDSSQTGLLKNNSQYESFSASVSSDLSVSASVPSASVAGSLPIDAAPTFTIDFSKSTSKYNYGGETVALDFSWYAPYKPAVDKVIVIFCWAMFFWRLFKTVPSILSGGDGIVTEFNGTDIRDANRNAYLAGKLGRK